MGSVAQAGVLMEKFYLHRPDGLLGESTLLPLTTTMPFSNPTSGKAARAKPPAAELSSGGDLDNRSEMVRFGAPEPSQGAR
jgi:hypothetical protein